jgi:hypothetical protein
LKSQKIQQKWKFEEISDIPNLRDGTPSRTGIRKFRLHTRRISENILKIRQEAKAPRFLPPRGRFCFQGGRGGAQEKHCVCLVAGKEGHGGRRKEKDGEGMRRDQKESEGRRRKEKEGEEKEEAAGEKEEWQNVPI